MKILKLKEVKTLSKRIQKVINGGARINGEMCFDRCLRSGSPIATCYQQCDLTPPNNHGH